MRESEVAEVVGVLMRAYPNANANPDMSRVYEASLIDLGFEQVQRAVARLIRSSKWLPTIAEIRETTLALELGPKRLGGEAWGDVNLEVRRTGHVGEPKFSDPLTAECVRLMGWRNICLGTNEASDRSRFIELYDGLQERERADHVSGIPLPAPKSGSPIAALTGRLGELLTAAPGGESSGPPKRVQRAPELPPRNTVNYAAWGDPNESIEARHARLREQARQLVESEAKESA